jgi:pimeloyl-ACP methyl ester carboxylesterase
MVISGQRLARRRRLAAGLLAFGLLAASSLSGSPAIAEPPVADIAAPVDIGGGRSLYLECHGSGGPTVILESGYHDSSDLWTISDVQAPVAAEPVLPALARTNRVCAYDRPGTLRYTMDQGSITNRSTPVPMPRTAADVVADLHALLTAAQVPGPYVFTAHSLGGLFARLYAQTYPGDVAGLVLVDTFSPDVPETSGGNGRRTASC